MTAARLPILRPSPASAGGLRALAADRRGAAAVEFALLLPLLLLLLAGATDGARLISRSMQAKAAAQAGADYVQRKGWDAAGVAGAVTGSGPAALTLDPAPRQILACVVNGAVLETTAATCANGRASGRYVVVASRIAFSPLIPWPRVIMPDAVRGQATVRIP